MLEYFTYKKVKKHQNEKRATESKVQTPPPLLDEDDEHFLARIISAEGTPPPLPERPHSIGPVAGDATENSSQVIVHDGRAAEKPNVPHHSKNKDKGKGKEEAKPGKEDKKINRLSGLYRSLTKRGKKPDLTPNEKVVTPGEAASEADDITKVLEDLNLSAINNRAFSISAASQEIVSKFTVILKDLVNGVPTAYDDLANLIEDSDGTLAKSYDSLPSFLQKLITQLPTKLTTTLAPELLAVATEAQAYSGFGGADLGAAAAAGGLGGAAKSFLKVSTLKDLVTKPGAVVTMLKYIMNALKTRWPAFMGTNVLLSLGLFVLLFVFWYCHKRGREVRLEKENPKTVDSKGRITELDDDPLLEGAGPSRKRTERDQERRREERRERNEREERREHRDHSDRSDRSDGRSHRSERSDRKEHSDRSERREHREHREHRERRDHGDREERSDRLSPSSPKSREHRHHSGSSTPSRSHTERRSSRRTSLDRDRRPKSSEYADNGERRDDDRYESRY